MNAIKNSPAATTHARSRCGKVLARASATLAAAGTAAFAFAGAGPASAATTPTGWEMTAGNVHQLSQQDSATASHFFNTPSSYGVGSSLVKTPVQAGYATTPVLGYTSYAQFASNIAGAAASAGELYILQDESNTTNLSQYASPLQLLPLRGPRRQARHQGVLRGLDGQRHGQPDGDRRQVGQCRRLLRRRTGRHPQADHFFQDMHTAGY
jgi:hypothetical protein